MHTLHFACLNGVVLAGPRRVARHGCGTRATSRTHAAAGLGSRTIPQHRSWAGLGRTWCEVNHAPTAPAAALATDAEAALSDSEEDGNDEQGAQDLGLFLEWLVANGVRGVGQPDSKLALYQGPDGDRGLVCIADVPAGELLLEVPLRLALTDHAEDEESAQLLYEGAPWSVRLACKLLRQQAAGAASPWLPYLRVLPTNVPAPVDTFSWEDMSSIRYAPVQEALDSAAWMATDAWRQASAEATGGCDEDAFRRALSVVHSRTFGTAARGGGVGVRLLVPLIDMFNHSGDQALAGGEEGGLGGERFPTDNVRWDLVPAEKSATGGWAMQVRTTAPVEAGEPLHLSYGERPNDDFFLHYGFVPRANPHDEVALFNDLEEAMEWHYDHIGAAKANARAAQSFLLCAREINMKLPAEQAEPLYRQALEASLEAQQRALEQQRAAAQAGPAPTDNGGGGAAAPAAPAASAAATADAAPLGPPADSDEARQLEKAQRRIKVVAGNQVSEVVMSAFAAVSGGEMAAAERALALRAAQMISTMQPPTLLEELAALAADADPRVTQPGFSLEEEQGTDAAYYLERLYHYHKVLLPEFAVPLLPRGYVESAPSTARSVKGKFAPPPRLGASAAGAGTEPSDPTAAAASAPAAPGSGSRPMPDALVRHYLQSRPLAVQAADAAGGSSGTAAAEGDRSSLSGPQCLVAALRANKLMVLWDLLLSTGVTAPEVLASGLCDSSSQAAAASS